LRSRSLDGGSAVDGNDALVESYRLFYLPGADCGAHRVWREHKDDCIGLTDQVAEALFPFLATGDAVVVDEAFKAVKIERRSDLLSECYVVSAVGDEDAKLSLVGRVGPARLLHSDTNGLRQSEIRCLLRLLSHRTAPTRSDEHQFL
jgi:hypothetical protein